MVTPGRLLHCDIWLKMISVHFLEHVFLFLGFVLLRRLCTPLMMTDLLVHIEQVKARVVRGCHCLFGPTVGAWNKGGF